MNVELHPREAQGTMSSLNTMSNWLFCFIVSMCSPILSADDCLGKYGLYFLFCGFIGVGFFFCIFFVPETRGKTPEDMKRYYLGEKSQPKPAFDNAGFNAGEDGI